MNKVVIIRFMIIILMCSIIISCDHENGSNNSAFATVTFFNTSSYPVDVFYNFNPQFIDSTTFIGTVDTISRELKVSVPASSDLLFGDTFYLRFKILLENSLETGLNDLYVHTERTMSNISFVIESGHSYTKVIEDPPPNELRFVNSVLVVRNFTSGQIWIENNGEILPQMGRETVWLAPGEFGFYTLTLPYLADSWPMDFLRSRDNYGNRTLLPPFVMTPGKRYFFKIENAAITGPEISNINFLSF